MAVIEEYGHIINRIFPSKDMKSYLTNRGLDNSVDNIEDLIFRAPVPIQVKMQALDDIAEDIERITIESGAINRNIMRMNQQRQQNYKNYVGIIHMAMMHMAGEGVYVVESANYNSDKNACELEFECVTATFEQAKEWINAQSAIEEYAMDVPR